MSGLFVGLMLRRRGFRVDIYERVVGELSGRGAGIVAQPTVIRAMQGLGIDVVGVTDHTIFKSIYFHDPSGHRLELSTWTATPDQVKPWRPTPMP